MKKASACCEGTRVEQISARIGHEQRRCAAAHIWSMTHTQTTYLRIVKGFDFEQGVGAPVHVFGGRLSDHEPLSTQGLNSLQLPSQFILSGTLGVLVNQHRLRTVKFKETTRR